MVGHTDLIQTKWNGDCQRLRRRTNAEFKGANVSVLQEKKYSREAW